MLTEEQIYECEDAAGKSYRRHKYSVRGQQITPADNPNWHIARAIEAEVRKQDEALIRQLVEDICGAKLCERNSMSGRMEMLRLMDKAITAGRARLEGKT